MNDLSKWNGEIRRFGVVGPLYEVLGTPLDPDAGHVRIRVIESGETADYPVAKLLEDPLAA